MDRLSVEGAISGQPELSGIFTWQDDSRLTFTPDAPFEPESTLKINIDTTAQSSKGMPLIEPSSYPTPLQLT